jgi:FKBP-type peptidyl-prolyl cis-trans isomerase
MSIPKILVALVLVAVTALAQTSTTPHTTVHRTTARPAASGPTKVTGDPTKTEDGLEYWDIKVGTGEEATTGSTIKVHYTRDGLPAERNSTAQWAMLPLK